MNPYHLTAHAHADLNDIWTYIARNNPRNADRFLAKIMQMIQLLADHPLVGRSREAFGPAMRSFPVGKHHIFYIPRDDGIEIRRIIHGQHSLEDELKK